MTKLTLIAFAFSATSAFAQLWKWPNVAYLSCNLKKTIRQQETNNEYDALRNPFPNVNSFSVDPAEGKVKLLTFFDNKVYDITDQIAPALASGNILGLEEPEGFPTHYADSYWITARNNGITYYLAIPRPDHTYTSNVELFAQVPRENDVRYIGTTSALCSDNPPRFRD